MTVSDGIISQKSINRWYTIYPKFLYEYFMVYEEAWGIRTELFKRMDIKPEDKIIEIGAGTGLNLAYYPDNTNLLFLDINKRMMRRARRREKRKCSLNTLFVQGDAKDLPFLNNSFDKAILTYALSAIPNNEYALQEAKRVVKPGGLIGILDFREAEPDFFGRTVHLDLPALLKPELEDDITGLKEIYRNSSIAKKTQSVYVLEVR